ncbi:MAG: calcium/sodium antiporter [Candidatus Omnitrophota bacterium]
MISITINILTFAVGLALLVYGSNLLIHACVRISSLFNLTPLFIGTIFVAFGTSMPEFGVSVIAALRNQDAIALGNVVGSNIANIGLVLGLCGFLMPLSVDKTIFKKELPIMLASTVLLYWFSLDCIISRAESFILIVCFIAFCFISYRGAKGQKAAAGELEGFKLKKILAKTDRKSTVAVLSIISLLLVIFGANLMVRSGVFLARTFGVSSWLIAMTVFAVGTSLPELAASLTASLKKVPSISVGNIVGSNIFNILLIIGIAGLIRPIRIYNPTIFLFEFPVLLVFSVFLFIFMRLRYRISRVEGLFLLLGYMVFLVVLIIK